MSGWVVVGTAVALTSAALMGLAIQRGATCMVAAVDEIVTTHRATRALALAEAALWVGGLLALAQLAGVLGMSPARYQVSGWTIVGGALLGLGAWVNRACVFGAIARIGSGQWAWLATPPGFFLGCLVPLHATTALPMSKQVAPFALTGAVALGVALLMVWRLVEATRAPRFLAHWWHPHRATLLIALTFVVTLLTVGLWAYTDALAALARGMEARLNLRLAMALALLGGAIVGGWIAGSLHAVMPRPIDLLRCAVGGALMGLGAMLVPGGNDGLILVGLPALLPHAWVAVTTMVLSIAALVALERRVERQQIASMAA
ncbi:MAG: YeeE/YedE thiosulfate transporter family protein [Sphingomonas sp.]|jgi:toxin CptA|uniref:YeeE/YedE thiosulfate transporter family protein n=1 Tax=Sphingomonas sp. TaxID=28214 RepID=UPI0035676242